MNRIKVRGDSKIKVDGDILIVIDGTSNLEILCISNSNITIYGKESNIKINLEFIYHKIAHVMVNFYNFGTDNEYVVNVNLDKKDSIFDYHYSTICKGSETCKVNVVHNSSNTTSNVINRGISLDNSSLRFDCVSKVPKGIKGCIINQDSRIIEDGKSKTEINPILLIDEVDVLAKHSAVVKKYDVNELFYLESKGIKKIDAIHLLNKGFLISNLNIENKNNIIDDINKYWR